MTTRLASASPGRTRLGFWGLAPFALGGGLLNASAFPTLSWWPAAFVAVAVLALVVGASRNLRTSVLLGLIFGLALNLVAVSWQAVISDASYLGLAILEALFSAVLAGLLHVLRGQRFAPVLSASAWVLVEAVQARWPFEGFAWLRLGYAMIDTPLAGLYPFVGAGVVSFVVALVGHLIAWAFGRDLKRWAVTAMVAAVSFGLGAAGTLLPGDSGSSTINVGWVQGGAPGGGVYGIGEAGTMQRNHAAETAKLLAKVTSGSLPKPAFIVWPENGTDNDPTADAATAAILAHSVAAAGVPILVAVPRDGPGVDERRTTSLWWTSNGPTASYDKRNLVPFGEWIPFRSILLPLIPMLQYVGAQTIPGTTVGALHVTGPDGRPLTVGVAICFEVAFPTTMDEAVTGGGEVMIVQSSNAMFQGTAQIEQQFAITRVRAAEMHRQVLVVTTSGISGLIDQQGHTVVRGIEHDADSGVVTLTRSTALSPVMTGGWLAEYVLAGVALLGLVARLGLFVSRERAGQWKPGTTGSRRESDDG